jgi:hypothetical protein
MVGGKNAMFTQESISDYYASHVLDKVWNIGVALGHGDHFKFKKTQFLGTDDHVYINKIAKIPSIDIVQYDPATGSFAPYWHTHDDNLNAIDKNTLEAVGETVLATVLSEAKAAQ